MLSGPIFWMAMEALLATGSVDTQIPGSLYLSCDYLDQAGNPADTVLRTVEVINRNPSSINLSHNRVEENFWPVPWLDF